MDEKERKGLYWTLDQLHLDYAKEVMYGKMQAKDFIFSTDKSLIKTLRELKPTMFVGNPLYFLKAFEYLLRDPKNLIYLPKIQRFWENSKLSHSAAYALSSLYKTLCDRSKIGYDEENRSLFEKASNLILVSLLRNQTVVSPEAFALLCSSPQTAMEKLPLLMGGHDYSSFMAGCDSKIATSRYICKYLMEQGLIRNIKVLSAYLEKITPDEIGTSAEIALQHSLSEAIKHEEKLTPEEYCRLSRALQYLPQASALNIWEKIIKHDMVQGTYYKIETRHGVETEVRTSELNMIINDLRLYAEKSQSDKVNISIIRMISPYLSRINSQSMKELLAQSVLSCSPTNVSDAVEILEFVRGQFSTTQKERDNETLRTSLKRVAKHYQSFGSCEEVISFKHWGATTCQLWSREGLQKDDESEFITFFCDKDWEKTLQILLWDKTLSPETRQQSMTNIIKDHLNEKPSFSLAPYLEKLQQSEIMIPSSWR